MLLARALDLPVEGKRKRKEKEKKMWCFAVSASGELMKDVTKIEEEGQVGTRYVPAH